MASTVICRNVVPLGITPIHKKLLYFHYVQFSCNFFKFLLVSFCLVIVDNLICRVLILLLSVYLYLCMFDTFIYLLITPYPTLCVECDLLDDFVSYTVLLSTNYLMFIAVVIGN